LGGRHVRRSTPTRQPSILVTRSAVKRSITEIRHPRRICSANHVRQLAQCEIMCPVTACIYSKHHGVTCSLQAQKEIWVPLADPLVTDHKNPTPLGIIPPTPEVRGCLPMPPSRLAYGRLAGPGVGYQVSSGPNSRRPSVKNRSRNNV